MQNKDDQAPTAYVYTPMFNTIPKGVCVNTYPVPSYLTTTYTLPTTYPVYKTQVEAPVDNDAQREQSYCNT
jgi:hypothetical protein